MGPRRKDLVNQSRRRKKDLVNRPGPKSEDRVYQAEPRREVVVALIDPDQILAEDWVAEVAGINAPGSFEEYAQAPYGYHKAVNDKILDGTYEHFYPRPN